MCGLQQGMKQGEGERKGSEAWCQGSLRGTCAQYRLVPVSTATCESTQRPLARSTYLDEAGGADSFALPWPLPVQEAVAWPMTEQSTARNRPRLPPLNRCAICFALNRPIQLPMVSHIFCRGVRFGGACASPGHSPRYIVPGPLPTGFEGDHRPHSTLRVAC